MRFVRRAADRNASRKRKQSQSQGADKGDSKAMASHDMTHSNGESENFHGRKWENQCDRGSLSVGGLEVEHLGDESIGRVPSVSRLRSRA